MNESAAFQPAVSPIAIVGMGGLFPSLSAPASPARLWEQVVQAADTSREPPPGRWLLSPDQVFDPAIAAPDRVYSRRGYYLDSFSLDPAGLDLPAGLLPEL